ncbi:hypothetical protein NE865_09089 [Phthorimaea operculella]|nr:hypothetical protein NE865_09089 [Phthorimaea operculella]
MMLTIHGLPLAVKYQDVKTLIRENCNITDYILDNLVSEGDGTKKVRIGLADEREGTYFIKCLDGFRYGSNMLRIVPFGKPQPSNPQQNFDQRGGGYPPRNDYPNQSNYGQQGRPMGGPDMMRQEGGPKQDSWGPGNSQWGPSQNQGSQVGQPPMQQNSFNNYQQGMNTPYGQEHSSQGNMRPPYDQRDQFHGQGRPQSNQGYGYPKNDIPSHGVSAAENFHAFNDRRLSQRQRYSNQDMYLTEENDRSRSPDRRLSQRQRYSNQEMYLTEEYGRSRSPDRRLNQRQRYSNQDMYLTEEYGRSRSPDRKFAQWDCNQDSDYSIDNRKEFESDDPDSHQINTHAEKVNEPIVKRKMTGSAKRRLVYWLNKGYDREEAEVRALRPLMDFPEYRENAAIGPVGEKNKHQGVKRPLESSSDQRSKESGRFSGPSDITSKQYSSFSRPSTSTTQAGSSKFAYFSEPSDRTSDRDSGPLPTNSAKSSNATLELGPSQAPFEWICNPDPDSSIEHNKSDNPDSHQSTDAGTYIESSGKMNTDAETVEPKRKRNLPGSVKRRFAYWLSKGYDKEEAGLRAVRPLVEFPEYREEIGVAGKNKQQGIKRPKPLESSSKEPSKKSGRFSGPPTTQVASCKAGNLREPTGKETSSGDFGPFQTNASQSRTVAPHPGPSQASIEWICNPDPDTSIQHDKPDNPDSHSTTDAGTFSEHSCKIKTDAETVEPKRKRNLPGSVKRRFAYWLSQGFDREEAELRALRPLVDFPEYREELGDVGKNKQQGVKRPTPLESSSKEPSKKSTFYGPSTAQTGSCKVGDLREPACKVTSRGDFGPFQTNGSLSRTLAPQPGPSFEWICNADPDSSIQHDKSDNLDSHGTDAGIVSEPSGKINTDAETVEPKVKRQMPGSAKRRFVYWLSKGYDREEAKLRALQPLVDFPEYRKELGVVGKNKQQGIKRPKPLESSSKEPSKKSRRFSGPFTTQVGTCKVGNLSEPACKATSSGDFGPLPTNASQSPTVAPHPGTSQASFEWICNPDPDSSIQQDKPDNSGSHRTTDAGKICEPSGKITTDAVTAEPKVKRKIPGSAKRRFVYWLSKGYDREEAELRALRPLVDFPEYLEELGVVGKNKQQGITIPKPLKSSSKEPSKKSRRFSGPSTAQAGSCKVGDLREPAGKETSRGDFGPFQTNGSLSRTVAPHPGPSQASFEWICNADPDSSIQHDKSDSFESHRTTDVRTVGDPSGEMNTQAIEPKVKRRLPGSAKRRLVYWLSKGYDREEAELRALRPLVGFVDKNKQQGVKKPKPLESSSKEPSKKSESSSDQPSNNSEHSTTQDGSCRVCIRDDNKPITVKFAAKIEEKIVNLSCNEGSEPNFKEFRLRTGILSLTCLNEESRNLLADRIREIKPWRGASLRLMDPSDIPKQVYVSAYVPNMLVGPDMILECLNAQNWDVGCDRWRLVDSKIVGSGQMVFFFGFDCSLLANLERKNFVLRLGRRKIRVKVMRRRNQTVENSDGSGTVAIRESPSNAAIAAPRPSLAFDRYRILGKPYSLGSGASVRLRNAGVPVIPKGKHVKIGTIILKTRKEARKADFGPSSSPVMETVTLGWIPGNSEIGNKAADGQDRTNLTAEWGLLRPHTADSVLKTMKHRFTSSANLRHWRHLSKQGAGLQANRPHVLRSVEIVDEPLNRPIAQPRYQTYEQPQKPITIMKENFQGPQYNLDRQPGPPYAGQGPPQGHHGPGHAGPHHAPAHQGSGSSPWAQPMQQDKPPFGKPSPNFDRKYPEPENRPMMAKPLNEPPRNAHDYGAKPGPRFSPRREIPDSHGKPGPRFSPRRDILDSHGKPGPRFSPRRDIPDSHGKPGPRFSPRRDIPDSHGKPGPRFSPRRDIPDPHIKPGPRFSPRRDVPDKPGPRFSPRRDVPDLHRRMPSPGRRLPSPGRRMPSPGRRIPSPGRRMPSPGRRMPSPGRRISPGRRMPSPGRRMLSPGRRMPSPGRRMPSPGHRMPSPGRRISPGRRMPSPGKVRGRPITPPHKRHDSPGRYSPRRSAPLTEKFGPDGRPHKDVRPAYDPPAPAPNQAMYSGGYRPSIHENVQYPILGARPMEARPSAWQDKAFPPGGKKEDDRRMPKFEPRIDAELKGRSPPRKSRSPIRRDRSPPRDRFKKHSPSPRSPRRSWALEKRRSPEPREAPPPPMWPGQPQEEPFRRFPDRPEEEKKRMPVWEPRRLEDERSFDNPVRVRSDLIARPPEPSPRGYKPDERIPPRESRFEPREPKFESREPKFEPRESRFEPREEFRRADDMLKRFDRDAREPHRPIDDVRRRDEFVREDYPRREEERKIPTRAEKFPVTFNKEFEDVYQRAQALKKRSEELRKRDLERRREELERDVRKPEFDSKFDRRDDRPPESGYTKEKRAALSHDSAQKAKRDKAIDEISTKIIDKHGSHFTGEMRTRVLEEMRIVVGKAMQDMFGYKDVSFIEMVVKFNAKYDHNAEIRMYNDVLESLPSMYRKLHSNKRPASDSRSSEIPAKSARRDHELVNRGDIPGNQTYIPEWTPNPVPPMMMNMPPPTIHIPNPMLMPQFDLVQQMGMMAQPVMVPAPTYDERDENNTFQQPTAQLPQHLQAAENLLDGKPEGYNLYLCKDDFSPYSSVQAEHLKKFLVAELVKASQSGQGWSPDFTIKGLQSVFRYEVETRDETTKEWLMNMDFTEFKLFNVLVYSKEELWYERAAIWLPGHSKCRNIEPLEKLRLQNNEQVGLNLNIGKWKLVKKIVTAKGTRIYVDMPPSSARALEKCKMLLSYELQKVSVFLKAVAVDKETFDAGLRENTVVNETVIADAAVNSVMPSLGLSNVPEIVHITLKGNKSITVQQARKIKEMLIYHIFKHQQSGEPGLRTDFLKFGYCLPGYLGVVPANADTKKWLMGLNLGKLHKQQVVVLGADEMNTKYIRMSVILSTEDNNRSKAMVLERLKQSNQGVKGLNFNKWKPELIHTPRGAHKPVFDIKMDLESVETIINKLNYTLDYVGSKSNLVLAVKYEHSEKRLLDLIKKLKSEMDDSYDVANMEIDSSDENDEDIVFMGEVK